MSETTSSYTQTTASTVYPSNAYQVLSAAEETFSTSTSTSSSTFLTTTHRPHSESSTMTISSRSSSIISGASFTLDGVSYIAYRPYELNQLTVVIQGQATTATLSPARPITLPINEVISLDLNGQPIVTGSTVYFSSLPASVAAVVSDTISTSSIRHPYKTSSSTASGQMSNSVNVAASSTSQPPSTAVWGNGIPAPSSTTSGASGLPEGQDAMLMAAIMAFGLALSVAR